MDVPLAYRVQKVSCYRFSVEYIQNAKIYIDEERILFTLATNFHIKRNAARLIVEESLGDNIALHKYSLATIQTLRGDLDGLFVIFRQPVGPPEPPLLWLMDPSQISTLQRLMVAFMFMVLGPRSPVRLPTGNVVLARPCTRNFEEIVVLLPECEACKMLPAATVVQTSPEACPRPR